MLLNGYFGDLRYAPMFNWSDSTRQQQPMRLPAVLNADPIAYYLSSRWIPTMGDEVKIIHFTLGPVSKPWFWWSTYMFNLDWKWNEVRNRLPRHGGLEVTEVVFQGLLFLAPYPLLALFFASLSHWGVPTTKMAPATIMCLVMMNEWMSFIIPTSVLFLSYFLTHKFIVPHTMIPTPAKYVFTLWSQSLVMVLFATYCAFCRVANSSKNQISRKKIKTLKLYAIYLVGYCLFAFVTPFVWPPMLRLLSFFMLAILHVIITQVVGQKVIRLWAGPRSMVEKEAV